MHLKRYLTIALLGALLPGCSESVLELRTIPGAPGLAGEWAAEPDDIGPTGWYQKRLTLHPDGRFASISASYGLYEGQKRNEPSAWTRINGSFRVDGNRVHFTPETMTWWDHFESADFPAPRHAAYPWGTLFDDATFVVEGNVLTLHFNVFPADAPIPVTAAYLRR